MIETRDLTKKYGELYALDRLTLRLEPGDLFGFIGPNGAGKTTTMKILATLLNPTYGEAYVCGHSIYHDPKEIRRLVGYMPDFFGVYDDMKVIEYLEFFAAAYRIKGPRRKRSLRARSSNWSISISSEMLMPTALARADAASGLSPRAAARASGAAARRTAERSRSSRPYRNA
jgi:ABC-type Na+ transport system ATPase subunit NatA